MNCNTFLGTFSDELDELDDPDELLDFFFFFFSFLMTTNCGCFLSFFDDLPMVTQDRLGNHKAQ